MATKFKDCGTLSFKQLEFLGAFVKLSVDSGKRDLSEILIDFYKKANFREPESRALFLGNIPAVVDMYVSRYIANNAESITEEEAKGLISLSEQAKLSTMAFSKAENIFDFIEKEIINPVTDGIVDEENEEETEDGKTEEETEEEQPDPEEEAKLRDKLMDDSKVLDDTLEEEKPETKEMPKIGKQDSLFKKAMYFRGGAQIVSADGSQTYDVYYENIKGEDYVYSVQNGAKTKPILLSKFLDGNKGANFVPHEAGRNSNGKKQRSEKDPFTYTLNWLKKKFTVAYGNAMSKVQSAMNYFSMKDGELTPGELTKVFARKNKYFATLSTFKNATLQDGFPKGTQAEFFAELSDYEYAETIKGAVQPYINIVAVVKNEKTGKSEKIIISNLTPPTDKNRLFKDEKLSRDPDVIAYRQNYLSLLKQLKSAPGSQVKIPGNTSIDKVYVPVLSNSNPDNFIYESEKERVKGALDKAKTLKFKDFKKLVSSMGFGVSQIMVDMNNKAESSFSSGAFVAVSPFHSPSELNEILSNEKEWASGSSLNDIAIRHNINIVYLQRKSLKFADFANALKGNLTGNKRTVDGKLETDRFKVKSMLNPAQSFRILNRIALAMEAIEARIAKEKNADKKAQLEAEFAKMVLYFFNNSNHYTLDINVLTESGKISRAIKDVRKGQPIPAGLSKQVWDRYNKWKKSSINDREATIREMAVARYGFFTSGMDADSVMERENKIEVLKSKVQEADRKSDANYLNEGGMIGMDVVDFFNWVDSHPELRTVAEKAFDVESFGNKAIEFATFNPPAVSKKDIIQEGSKIVPAGKVYDFRKDEVGDLNEEYLEAVSMPMMPHVVVNMDSIMKASGVSYDSSAKEGPVTQAPKGRGNGLKEMLRSFRKRTFRGSKESGDLFISMLSEEQAREMTESLLGNLASELQFNASMLKLKEGMSLGKVYKGLFELHSINGKVSEKVLRHEIFHKVLNEILDPASYERVIAEGYKMLVAEKGPGNYTNEEVDEYLAERYENTFGSYSNKFTAKLPSWLRWLFQEMRNLYRRLTGNFSEFQNLLETLESGGYKTSKAIYNHYDGTVRNKELKDSELVLSMKLGFGNNEQEVLNRGYQKFRNLVFVVRQNTLSKIYQNEELFIESNMAHMSIESAVNATTADFKEIMLAEAERLFPDLGLTKPEQVIEKVNSLTPEQLLENEELEDLRDLTKGYEQMDSLREHAFDFFDFSSNVNYEYDVESDPELVAQLDPDTGQDSSLSQMADRGALSGIKTMNKRVKFHVENTQTVDGKQISTSKAHQIMVRLVDDMPRGPKGEFRIADFITEFSNKLENLALSSTSLEYKTMKAVWNKFLNPVSKEFLISEIDRVKTELESNNNPQLRKELEDLQNELTTHVDSFLALSMKRSDNPSLQAYYDRHGDVLTAFISAYSTIAIQEFVRPVGGRAGIKMRPTHSNRNVELKNEYNSNYIRNNFQRKVDNGIVTYQMKSDKITSLFGGSGHISLAVKDNAFQIEINKKVLAIPFENLDPKGSGYTDLDKSFLNEVLNDENGITDSHMVVLFRAMGFMISDQMIPRYLNPTDARNQTAVRKARRKELYWHGIMSYLIMAQQMVSEAGINPDASADLIPGITPEALKKLEAVGNNRTDMVANILREDAQGTAELKIQGSMFTPTKFSEFFKELGNANAEFQIGSGSMFETIANAKHNKDKINTPLKNRVKTASRLHKRLQTEAKQAGRLDEAQEFIAEKYPNLASSFYFNDLVSGELNVSDYWQLQTLESFENNTSKTFLDMNNVEFQRVLLTGLLNGVENTDGSSFDSEVYWHPADIQADRGYLPVFKANKRYRSSYSSEGGISVSADMKKGLLKNYYHGFNSALSILKQIAQTPAGSVLKYKGEPLADVIDGANPQLVAEVYNQINKDFNSMVEKDPTLLKALAEHGVWQKIGGKFLLNQLIHSKVNTTEEAFMQEQIRLFNRFARAVAENFLQENNPLKNDLNKSKVYENANADFEKQNIKGQLFTPVSFFKFKDLQEAIENGVEPDMMKLSHPALFDMYMTYRINNLQVRQVLFGEMHSFKAQKGLNPRTEAAYVVEYSKRMTGAGTSKINPAFYEAERDEAGNLVYEFSRNGLNRNIRVINMENNEYLFSENPKFLEDIAENRGISPEQVQKMMENGSFDIDDGAIWSSSLFQSLLRNSMGNSEGFPIDSLMKLILNDVNLETGHVDYDKALHISLTPELMSEVGPLQEMYLKSMYSSGWIMQGEGTRTLWDVYQEKFTETNSRTQAEQAVLTAYLEARRDNRIVQEPAMYVNTRTSVKGTAKGINLNPMQGLKVQDENSYLSGLAIQERDLSTGFGGVLDLMGEITDKDIALSSQMLYLLGIVGDKNHHNVQATYKALESLSNINSSKIEREVSKIMKDKSINERNEAVRAWAIDMIRKSYEAQGEYGAGYKLAQDFKTQSVSNPLHKNKMFGAIAAKINKGIGIRVKGFKGIQLPATNFLFLYQDENGGTMTRSEAKARGYSDEQLEAMKRNLSYAQIDHEGKKITQTEVITGNFFAKKFGTGNKSLRQVFTVTLKDGGMMDVEASDYQAIQETTNKEGQRINPRRAELYRIFQLNFLNIDWKGNSGLSYALDKAKIKAEKLTKKITKLKESEDSEKVAERTTLKRELDLIETKIVVMKNMLKGSEKVEQNNAGLVAYEVADAYLEMNKSLYGVMSRIPNTGKNSSSVFRVRAFMDGYKNGVFVPAEWLEITGSDHDGDTAMFWQHGSKDKISESMLESTINILSDYDNKKEIFSDIDSSMNFVKKFAETKQQQEIEKGNGYTADDLFTMDKVRANNGVGSTMTGSSALVAKAYAYAYRSKMQFIARGGDMNLFQVPNLVIGNENPSLNPDLKVNGMIPEISTSGEFVYKWLETLTNAAIDNAKYLTMGSLNLKRLNSNLQAAMVFMGFSKQTIAEFYSHPTVEEVFKLADSMNDSGGKYFSFNALEKAVAKLKTGKTNTKVNVEGSLSYVADPVNQKAYDRDYILNLLVVLNSYASDFKKIQNVLKVSDQIKGTPYEQRKQFDKIRQALGFRTVGQVEEFISQYKESMKKGGTGLEIELLQRGTSNKIMDPKIIMLMNPNLMGYLSSHIDFLHKTGSHLLYTEPMIRTRYLFEKIVNRDLIDRPFFKGKLDNAFYQQLGTLFLDGFGKGNPVVTQMNEKEFNLSSLEHRVAFVQEFKEMVWNLKRDNRFNENDFVDQLTFDGDLAEIKMSHNFDSAQEVSLLNSFNSLDQETKDNFFYYLLITDGLVFKKHGFMKFISPDAYRNYNMFLKSLESNPEQIMDTDIINSFVHNFLISNKDMVQEFNINKDLSKDEIVNYTVNNTSGSYLDKSELFDAEELEVNPKIKEELDKITYFNPEAKKQISDSRRKVQAAVKAIQRFEDQLADIIIDLIPTASNDEGQLNEEGETILDSILNAGLVTEIEPNAKWSKKKLERHSIYMNSVELLEKRKNDLKTAQVEDEALNNQLFKEKSYEEEMADNIRPKNRSPYRVVKLFDEGKVTHGLFKLSRKGGKLVWRKVVSYQGLLGHAFNGFQSGKIMPLLETDEAFESIDYATYELVKKGEIDKIPKNERLFNKKTNFFTRIDENGKMDSYQLTDGMEKAESRQKLKAIASVIQKAFPGIQIKFVSNQKGMRSNAKGFMNSGVVYINVDLATSDTPLHEVGHILIDLIEQQNPELFKKLSRLVMSHPVFEQISEKYQQVGNNELDNIKEAFVTLLGKSQQDLLADVQENLAPAWTDTLKSFWSEIKNALRTMYEALGMKSEGVSEKLISELGQQSKLEDFFHIIGKAVVEGKVLTDISSKQFAALQMKHNGRTNASFTKAQINAKIKELTQLGIITRTCN